MRQEKIALVFYGLPGSGKGTQANLAANAFGLTNFDTGKYLEALWYDPKRQGEAIIKRERKLFEDGKLNTQSFVLNEVSRAVQKIATNGQGVVFSGSPRTMHEAEALVPLLEKLYGKKNLFFFLLDVDRSDSLARNSKRLLCKHCRAMLLTQYYPSKKPVHCPVCAGELYKRTLDNVKVIPRRLDEYEERTKPVLGYLKKRGTKVTKLDGRPAPYHVFARIEKHVSNALGK